LYNPWFAASDRVISAFSGVSPNTRRPYGFVQRNISSTRKYRCSSATTPTRPSARSFMG
jgi:hypothetical protein